MQRLHCFLVRFEQFAGELTEDGQVGEVRRRRSVWGLTKLLEHKLYAVPAHVDRRVLETKTKKAHTQSNPSNEKRARADLWIMTTHSRNLKGSPKVRANRLASSLMLVKVWTPGWALPPLSCSRFRRTNSCGKRRKSHQHLAATRV